MLVLVTYIDFGGPGEEQRSLVSSVSKYVVMDPVWRIITIVNIC